VKLAIIVPTVDGRQEILARCVQAYSERSESATVDTVRFFVEPNHETCGIAWNAGADRAMEWGADFLHFTADDITPGTKWLAPCIRSVGRGHLPAGLVCWHEEQFVLDPLTDLPYEDDRLPQSGGYNRFFEDDTWPEDGSLMDRHEQHCLSVPFCSAAQWAKIGPSIATHYGTEKWLTLMAWENGMKLEVCRDAVFYHTSAAGGRAHQRFSGWLEVDLLSFDIDVVLPLYWEGVLDPRTPHPERGTAHGRDEARAMHMANVHGETVRPWYPEHDPSQEFVDEAKQLRDLRAY
jgi:hypothetical protein